MNTDTNQETDMANTITIVEEPTRNNYSWYVVYVNGEFKSQWTSERAANNDADGWR